MSVAAATHRDNEQTEQPQKRRAATEDSVSVIIPAYNCGVDIRLAFDSAVGQRDVSLEIIIVNDGSTDETLDVLRELERQNESSPNPVSLTILTQENQGPAVARNLAVQHATSEWIAFLDHDDTWTPDKLMRQLETARTTGAEFVITAARIFGMTDRVAEFRPTPTDLDNRDPLRMLLNDNFVTLSSVLMRRSALIEAGGFDEHWTGVEDWALWLTLAGNGVPFAAINEPLVEYKWHAQSFSRRHEFMQQQRRRLVRHALDMKGARSLNTVERRQILAAERVCSGWFMAQQSPWRAVTLYGQALIAWPFQTDAWKGLIKCLLGRS